MIPDLYIHDQDGPDRLEQGIFLLRMARSFRVDVPIRVWFGPPEDPDAMDLPAGERPVLDRSPRWQIEINGVPFGDPDAPPCIAGRPVEFVDEFWPHCKANPIDLAEYRYRVARADHAERWDEQDPFGGTGRRIDPMTAPLPDY